MATQLVAWGVNFGYLSCIVCRHACIVPIVASITCSTLGNAYLTFEVPLVSACNHHGVSLMASSTLSSWWSDMHRYSCNAKGQKIWSDYELSPVLCYYCHHPLVCELLSLPRHSLTVKFNTNARWKWKNELNRTRCFTFHSQVRCYTWYWKYHIAVHDILSLLCEPSVFYYSVDKQASLRSPLPSYSDSKCYESWYSREDHTMMYALKTLFGLFSR